MPRVTIDHLWLIVPAALVVWRGLLQPVRLLDFWWHLKAGEVIVTSGSIPRTEDFSFTAAGHTSIPHCWLAQALYYLGYCVGGLPLLIACNVALLLGAFLLVFCLCLEDSGSGRSGVVSGMLAAISLALFSGMRPHVFSFVLLASFHWILLSYRGRLRDWLWALPLLMALWVNLHGAFIIGWGLCVLILVCEALRRLTSISQSDVLSGRELAKLGAVVLVTSIAILLNPEGYGILGFVRTFGNSKYDFVLEWQVPRINSLEGILIFYGPFFVSLVVLFWTRQRIDLTELGIFLTFAAFGLSSYRNGVWFSLVSAPIVARHLRTIPVGEYLARLKRNRFTGTMARLTIIWKDAPNPRYGLNLAIAAFMVLITVVVSPWVYPTLGLRPSHSGLLEKETPVGAMDYLAQHQIQGHIFHPQLYGDYLVWRLWPRQRAFFDSQVHLFGATLLEDYALVFLDRHWEERLERYDIRFLLLRKDADDNQMMIDDARHSVNWRVLHEDGLSVLFEKCLQ